MILLYKLFITTSSINSLLFSFLRNLSIVYSWLSSWHIYKYESIGCKQHHEPLFFKFKIFSKFFRRLSSDKIFEFENTVIKNSTNPYLLNVSTLQKHDLLICFGYSWQLCKLYPYLIKISKKNLFWFTTVIFNLKKPNFRKFVFEK